MKRFLIFMLLFWTTMAHAQWGGVPGFMSAGPFSTSSVSSFEIDSNFVFETSGDAIGVVFAAEAQTNGALTVYVYCTAASGTPNESTALIYASATGANDPDRPDAGSSPLATSSNTDASGCSTAGWLTYSFTGLTLTGSGYYWFVLKNDEGAPTTDKFSVLVRSPFSNLNLTSTYKSTTTTNGFATDPTAQTSIAPIVIKFASGSVIGNPFVATAAHASNTNWRGMRVNFSEDVSVVGFYWGVVGTTINAARIYQGSTQVVSVTPDPYAYQRGLGVYFPAVTLTGGLDYDFVIGFSSAATVTNIYTMGNSPPADVQSLNPNFTYVDGATPGSLTETADSIWAGMVLIDDNPAQTGGGASGYTFVQ